MLRLTCPIVLVVILLACSTVSASGVRIGGRVVAPEGAVLPEAEIVLLPLDNSLDEAYVALFEDGPEPAARVLAGDGGHFEIEAPRAGLWKVRVHAQGFVPLEMRIGPLLEPVRLGDALLVRDSGITVRVSGSGGRILAGATVRLDSDRSRFSFMSGGWRVPMRCGVTSEDGTLRLPRGERERVVVSIAAPGYGYEELRGIYGTSARVTLEEAMPTRIRVLSAEGKPAAGVLVALGQRPHPLGRSGEDGRFEVAARSGSEPRLTLRAPDSRSLQTRLVTGRPADAEPLKLSLPDRLAVAGRVIDADSRRPVESGLVWDEQRPMEASVTDRSGGFALGGSAGERMSITAGAPGFLPADGREFQLVDDGRAGPTLVLRPAAAVEGKIVDGSGTPVPGAEIELEVKRIPGMMRIEIGRTRELPRTLSGQKGEFRLSPLDPENNYEITVRGEGFAPAVQTVSGLEPYRTKTGLRVELTRGHEVTGTVLDGDGHPVRDASVSLAASRTGEGPGHMRIMEGGEPESFAAESDVEGRFSISGIPAGKFDLTVRRSGFAKHELPALELTADEESLEVGEIVLQPGERIEGLVRDRDGQPLEGVEVYLSESGPMMMFFAGPGSRPEEPDATSEPGGWFGIEDLSAGQKYNLRFRRAGYTEKSISAVEAPRVEPLEVVLDPASDVSGRVVDEEGEPVAGARVSLSRERSIEMGGAVMVTMMMEGAESDAEGRFLFEDQEPGRIDLSAVASGYQEAELKHLEVPSGADLEGVEIPLPAGAILEGKVVAPDGRPAIGASVRRVTESPEMIRMGGAGTDGEGRYRLEGLRPGPISIEATHEDYPRAVKDIELRAGVNSLDLLFAGGQEVSGRVISATGVPVPGAAVRLAPVGRFWGGPETSTESDGAFLLEGVQDGRYSVRAEAEGYAPSAADVQIDVAGEPVQGLELQVDVGGAIYGRITGLDPQQFRNVQVNAEGVRFEGFNQSAVDREGNYRIENLLPATYTVTATLADSGRRARDQAVLVPGAPDTRLDLQFGSGLTLSGRAVQGDAGVVGATVFTEGIDVDHTGWSQTDLEGWFSIEGLEPGRYELRVRNFQTGLAHDETVDLATSREIVIEVPTARIRGRVIDSADRQPLAGVSLVLDAGEENPLSRLPVHTATSDLNGEFQLLNIADGDWRLSADLQGYAAVSVSVPVQHSKDVAGLELSLDATEGLILEARLPTGAVPDGLAVAVLDPAGGALVSGQYATGENGRVRLSSVPRGTWELVVSAAGSATLSLSAPAPGPAIPVPLPPATRLRVRVPALEGTGGVAVVRVTGADGRPHRTLTWTGQPRSEWRMTGAEIEFATLPPGTWNVSISAPDGRSWQGTTVTTAGAPATLTLEE